MSHKTGFNPNVMDKIIKIIEEAFHDRPYPGDAHLAGGAAHNHANCPCEYSYVANYFKGKRWRDITFAGLQKDYPGPPDACLNFMSHEASRFYLPAYMIIAVKEYEQADTAGDSAVFYLTPQEEDLPQWKSRVKGFTPEQKEAILVFLEYINAHDKKEYSKESDLPAQKALEYWRKKS